MQVQKRECAGCWRATDNKNVDCPPRMADGRLFTDYRPRCDINFVYPPRAQYLDSYNYRLFLIQNADEIMGKFRQSAEAVAACGTCSAGDPGTMLPEQSKQQCNDRTCSFQRADPQGLGLGRNYASLESFSAAPTAAIKHDGGLTGHLAAKHASCCATNKDHAMQSGMPDVQVKSGRYASPSGGSL